MKIRSKTELQEKVNSDIAQRKIEIINLMGLLHHSKNKNEILLAKCLVVLSYSHWEGFVKNSSKFYLMYIKNKGLSQHQYSQQLRSSLFYRHIMKKNDSITNKILLTEDCLYHNMNLEIDINDLCDTESNLNFETLKKILFNLGIRSTEFDTKELFINEKIIADRNKFAHGELQPYTKDEACEIADETIKLMDKYKTEIENAIAMESYQCP